MPKYKYDAFNCQGKSAIGTIEAASFEDAGSILRNRDGLFVNKIEMVASEPVQAPVIQIQPITEQKIDLIGEIKNDGPNEGISDQQKIEDFGEYIQEQVESIPPEIKLSNELKKIIEGVKTYYVIREEVKKLDNKSEEWVWKMIDKQVPNAIGMLLGSALLKLK